MYEEYLGEKNHNFSMITVNTFTAQLNLQRAKVV